MEHLIKINIKDILEFGSDDSDRRNIADFIIHDLMRDGERNAFIAYLLNDLMEGELEFENREKIINAYRTLIKDFKQAK